MTLAAACAIAALRSLLVAAVSVLVAGLLLRTLPAPRRPAPWAWLLALSPALAPGLFLAYAWRGPAVAAGPLAAEAAYALLLGFKLAPLALLVLAFAPPPALSEEARFCASLAPRPPLPARLAMVRHGPWRHRAIAFTLVFLLAFQEFELASLIQVGSWTDWIFTAHAIKGLDLAHTLRWSAMPLACEAAVLAAVLPLVLGGPGIAAPRTPARPAPPAVRAAAWAWMIAAAFATVIAPAWTVAQEAASSPASAGYVLRHGPELAAGLAFAAAAALLAWSLAAPLSKRLALAVPACLPGLLGPWALSIGLLAAFTSPGLRAAYDSPLPLLLALGLLLLPCAVLLRLLADALQDREGQHLAGLLAAAGRPELRVRGRALLARLQDAARWGPALLLFGAAYFELTAPCLLAPTGMSPATVLLYNQMHYGRTSAWAALLLATLALPVLGLAAILGGRALIRHRQFHAA